MHHCVVNLATVLPFYNICISRPLISIAKIWRIACKPKRSIVIINGSVLFSLLNLMVWARDKIQLKDRNWLTRIEYYWKVRKIIFSSDVLFTIHFFIVLVPILSAIWKQASCYTIQFYHWDLKGLNFFCYSSVL